MSSGLTRYTFDANGNFRRDDRFYMPDVDGDSFYRAADVEAEVERLKQELEHTKSVMASEYEMDMNDVLRKNRDLTAQLAASVPLTEHNRIVANTITALDAERTMFEQQLAQMTQERDEALGCLGYPVPASTPTPRYKCGLCEARERQLATAQARIEELRAAFFACIEGFGRPDGSSLLISQVYALLAKLTQEE
jgi:hypothetical protein